MGLVARPRIKAAVDLEVREGQVLDVGEGPESRAEVVEG
jgi:hypothetical protein